MKVYLIPGLGADERVFRNISLPAAIEPVCLHWIPQEDQETLPHYAGRLAAQIDSSSPFVLIGLSFGGMLATEIARIKKPEQLILISSIASPDCLPGRYRLAARFGLQHWVPVSFLKSASILRRVFSTETREEKKILWEMVGTADSRFLRWAMQAILSWEQKEKAVDCIQIHGTRDELLPIRRFQPTHRIERAGHMMVMNRAAEINRILEAVLKNLSAAQSPAMRS